MALNEGGRMLVRALDFVPLLDLRDVDTSLIERDILEEHQPQTFLFSFWGLQAVALNPKP